MPAIMILLVAFLGNFGKQYAGNRHNVAWQFADSVDFVSSLSWQKKFKGAIREPSIRRNERSFFETRDVHESLGREHYRGVLVFQAEKRKRSGHPRRTRASPRNGEPQMVRRPWRTQRAPLDEGEPRHRGFLAPALRYRSPPNIPTSPRTCCRTLRQTKRSR